MVLKLAAPFTSSYNTNKMCIKAEISIKLVIILGLLSGLAPFCTDLYLPALPIIQTVFNQDYSFWGLHLHSATLVNLTLACSMFGIAWGQVIMGYFSDSYGRKNVLLVSMIGFSIFSYLCSLSSTILELVLWRFLQGIFAAGGVVITRAMGYDMFKGQELLRFMAILMLVFGLAPVLSPIFGAFLLETNLLQWRGLFVLLAMLGVILFLAAWSLDETLPKEKRSQSGFRNFMAQFWILLHNKTFVLFLLINSFAFGSLFSYIAASSFVFQNIYGLDKTQYSYLFAINALGVIIVASSVARLSVRFSAFLILKIGLWTCFIGAIGILVAVFVDGTHLYSLVVPLFIVVAGFGAIASTSVALGMNAVCSNGGIASGLFGVTNFTFAGCMAPLVAVLGELDARPMAVLMFLCSLVALVLFFITQKRIG